MTESAADLTLTSGPWLAAVDARGGGLRVLRYEGEDIVDGYPRGAAIDGGRGQILAPWPNRLADGTYGWEGKRYAVDITEPGRQTANHGLVRRQPWTLSRVDEQEVLATFELTESRGYPFRVMFQVRYRLSERGLSVATTVENRSERAAPFGLGFHPYVAAPEDVVDDAVLHAPVSTVLELDDRGLPTGHDMPAQDVFGPPNSVVDGRRLDHCATGLERDKDGLAWVRVSSADGGRRRTLWMDESFTHLMIFTGDTLARDRRRRSVAIEPMTCPPNALATGDGVIRLLPGETRTFHWGMGI